MRVRELSHWNNHFKRASKPPEIRVQSDSGEAKPADQGSFQVAWPKPVEPWFFPTRDTLDLVEEATKEYREKVCRFPDD